MQIDSFHKWVKFEFPKRLRRSSRCPYYCLTHAFKYDIQGVDPENAGPDTFECSHAHDIDSPELRSMLDLLATLDAKVEAWRADAQGRTHVNEDEIDGVNILSCILLIVSLLV